MVGSQQQDLQARRTAIAATLSCLSCETLDKSLNFSVPQIPLQSNGDDKIPGQLKIINA